MPETESKDTTIKGFNYHFEVWIHKEFQQLSLDTHKNISELVANALKEYLDKEEKK